MRILLLGATGNLGRRLVPALLAHGHTVTAMVRSVDKLRSLLPQDLFSRISTIQGDALDSAAVEAALREHNCDAVMNTAGNFVLGGKQVLGPIATSVSTAAIRVAKNRGGKPLRAWFIGGIGSLEYPGTGGWQIQDFVPQWGMQHHRGTEDVMRKTSTAELEWSLLCVGWMRPELKTVQLLTEPRGHNLVMTARKPPEWRDSWVRSLPVLGVYLNLVPSMVNYTTKLEDVADMLAEDFEKGRESEFVGEMVGMKEVPKPKVT